MGQVRHSALVKLIRYDRVIILRLLASDHLALLVLSFTYEVEYLSSEEYDAQDLEVSLGIDVQEVQHHVGLSHAVDQLVDISLPSLLTDVALREFLAVKEESDDPEDFVAEIQL